MVTAEVTVILFKQIDNMAVLHSRADETVLVLCVLFSNINNAEELQNILQLHYETILLL
jgi:hypothetical protein